MIAPYDHFIQKSNNKNENENILGLSILHYNKEEEKKKTN